MAFFNKLGDLAKSVGEKTSDVVETTRINSKINSEKSEITEKQRKIGEYYYEKHVAGGNVDDAVLELIEAIDEHNRNIVKAQEEIARIKEDYEHTKQPAHKDVSAAGSLICQSCGASNPAATKFCSECGSKLELASAKRVCPSCGAEVPEGIKFCGECGTKFE